MTIKKHWIPWLLGLGWFMTLGVALWIGGLLHRYPHQDPQVLARIENQIYTLHHLEEHNREAFQKREQLYRFQKEKVKVWLHQTVLELEAHKKGMTTTALIEAALKVTPPQISDQDVQALIQRFGKIYPDPQHPDQKTYVPESDARQYLEHLHRERITQELAEKLLANTSYEIFLHEPQGPRLEQDLATSNRPSWGSPTAPVKIVIFSDFECPYSKRLSLGPLKQLQNEYGDRVFVVHRDLPISHHKYAYLAAMAAKCAARQGKFWDFHDLLFQNQHALDREHLITLAQDIQLDIATFKNCLLDKSVEAQVEEDIGLAATYGFRVTPTLVINGEVIEGVIGYDDLKEKIQNYLK